jgi:site-specific recombinase XerD
MRVIVTAHRKRLQAAMVAWCSRGNVVALRTRALVELASDTGLRVHECCALDLQQLRQDPAAPTVRFASQFYLRPAQAKGRQRGAGVVHVGKAARAALRAYVLAARAAGWIKWPASSRAALFVGHRGQRGRAGHARLSVRSAQHSWHVLQARAGIPPADRYNFHALRHTATSRLRAAGADVFDLATQMRWKDLRHAQRYVHEIDSASRLPALQARAGRL